MSLFDYGDPIWITYPDSGQPRRRATVVLDIGRPLVSVSWADPERVLDRIELIPRERIAERDDDVHDRYMELIGWYARDERELARPFPTSAGDPA
jgi:hypothetical protein